MAESNQQRIGLLGGSFDPIHLGHMAIATHALSQAKLDLVYFIPSAQSPLKNYRPTVSDADRLAMVQLAIGHEPRFRALEIELERGGASFTVDTVSHLKALWPKDALFWIIGADQVEKLPRWHRIDVLLKKVIFLCHGRPGYRLNAPPGIASDKLQRIEGELIDVSSSQIRSLILKDDDEIRKFLPATVADFITHQQLYR